MQSLQVRSPTLWVLFLPVFFYLVADLGLFSSYDALVFVVLAALAKPSKAYLLTILACTVQDAAGLSVHAWYPAVIVPGTVAIIYFLCSNKLSGFSISTSKWRDGPFPVVLFMGIVVAVYGTIISILLGHLGFVQSTARPPYLIGPLCIFMMICGFVFSRTIMKSDYEIADTSWVLNFALINGLTVLVLQVVFGPTFIASAAGAREILSAAQLVSASPLGFPRLTGTFLTPNGFALAMILLLVLNVYLRFRMRPRPTTRMLLAITVIGGIFAVSGLSKSMVILVCLVSMIVAWQRFGFARGWILTIFCVLAALSALLLTSTADWHTLALALRIPDAADVQSTYRLSAWLAAIDHFSWANWVFGTGFSYWPTFLEQTMGHALAGPHDWILESAGSFGLLGFLYYSSILLLTGWVAFNSVGARRYLAASLFCLFGLVDLVEMQYVISNAPISFLVWAMLGIALYDPKRSFMLPVR